MQTKLLAALALAIGLSAIIALGLSLSSRLNPSEASGPVTRTTRAEGMVELSGRITDSYGAPAAGVSVQIQDPLSKQDVGTAITDDDGRYSALIAAGTYTLDVTPTNASLQSLLAPGRTLTSDTTIDISLQPQGVPALTGHVVNPEGIGVPGQWIDLLPLGSTEGGSAETGPGGEFAIPVSPGSYRIRIRASSDSTRIGTSGNPVDQVPETYDLVFATALNLARSFMVDLVLPTKHLSINVQDDQGQPVAEALVQINLSAPTQRSMSTTGGVVPVTAIAVSVSAVTDAGGNAGMWLFPNDPSGPYALSVTPSDGSDLLPGSNPELVVTDDQTESIVLSHS